MNSLTLIFGTVASGKTAEFLRLIKKVQYHNDHTIKTVERKKLWFLSQLLKPIIITISSVPATSKVLTRWWQFLTYKL